jgi:hypothetical protein
MRKMICVLPVLLIIIVSCNNSNKSNSVLPYHVNIERDINNVSSVPLSSIGSKLEYVPLATDSSCVIARISTISVTDSFIFVSDRDRLFLFSRNGRFLKKIGSAGRGPGEYTNIDEVRIDEQNRDVYILASRVIHVYNFNGQFERDFKIDFPTHQFVIDKDKNLIFNRFSLPFPSPFNDFSWYFFDRNGALQLKVPNYLKRVNQGMVVPTSPLYIYNGTPHFMEFGIDTLYNYENKLKIPYAVFQSGKIKFPPDPTPAEVPNIKRKVIVSDIREIQKLLLMRLWWNFSDSISSCIYDKTISEFSVLDKNGFSNDIDNGLTFWPKKVMSDNCLVDYKDAFELIKYSNKMKDNKTEIKGQLKEIIKNLTESSNPVIIILKK